MKIKKFLSVVSLSALTLCSVLPLHTVRADGDVITSACLHHLDSDSKGYVMFSWEGKDGRFAQNYCCWIVLNEDSLKNNAENNFSCEQCKYLVENQLKTVKWEDFRKAMGMAPNRLQAFFAGKFDLTTMESLVRSLAKSSDDSKNVKISQALDEIVKAARHESEPEPVPVMCPEPVPAPSPEPIPEPSPEPASESPSKSVSCDSSEVLTDCGITVYYYRGWVRGTSWIGYIINNSDQFKKWCTQNDINEDNIKILAVCQNLWLAKVSSLSFLGDKSVDELLPAVFVGKLEDVQTKCEKGAALADKYDAKKETYFASVIDRSESTVKSIEKQFGFFGLTEKSKNELLEIYAPLKWNFKSLFRAGGMFSWIDPIPGRIQILKGNGDIS